MLTFILICLKGRSHFKYHYLNHWCIQYMYGAKKGQLRFPWQLKKWQVWNELGAKAPIIFISIIIVNQSLNFYLICFEPNKHLYLIYLIILVCNIRCLSIYRKVHLVSRSSRGFTRSPMSSLFEDSLRRPIDSYVVSSFFLPPRLNHVNTVYKRFSVDNFV